MTAKKSVAIGRYMLALESGPEWIIASRLIAGPGGSKPRGEWS